MATIIRIGMDGCKESTFCIRLSQSNRIKGCANDLVRECRKGPEDEAHG